MDQEHTDDLLNHLEKQHELLIKARRMMTQELQKVEVEEEMMMKKLYELMSTHYVNKKKMETQNMSQTKEIVEMEASSDKPFRAYYRRRLKNVAQRKSMERVDQDDELADK
ncbi:hypothetical protein EUTSA_v10000379mg [Eutrema salsugineum]|uniref:Uncharacterized protein n=1 Tax=Eutrema salsugineum TaxID=72664 RepID=V4LUQ0_EUTSA|nr:uncharacterized protein LOC18021770 [Eutrema salsugineum]ESQ46222.1 hypothetical protein EUTSA_v10000379mg [Eutrema salsugineum]